MSNLLIETKDGVRTITLNRPDRHNAFDDALIKELTEAFSAVEDVRAVVLQSTGKSFSAGGDLAWMKRMAANSPADNLNDAKALSGLMEAMDSCPRPVIGVVQGAAYGGGVGLVACCDLAVAAETANFCLSEVKLGLIPAAISPYVVRAMGGRVARRYSITAEVFTAATALSCGLVHEVVPADRLDEVRDAWLARLAANSPKAMGAAKRLIRRVADDPLDTPLRDWTAAQIAEIRASDEGREGVAAFLEKRKPSWVT
ncbi:enoyl-CoA hydratase [Paramagnetospirillum kuznetsovii]|uniref:Enoyl-CoA hydratase n=1 Tax=Paramagnetospirillum kuznetsovii TaxID=2053833 RepID=A0A364P225_9PROT|nr:enoyl-CoA hydratase/isomerase family protein [Paramagnetospirillum kuznetsovii]RAU23217.1 enoyl-CoA hydratase [Paramagnetospirillum kuznetsovii]